MSESPCKLPNLEKLERLQHLPPGVFAGVTAKKVSLRLESNLLRDLPADAFDGFTGVLFLYLEKNPLDPALARQIYRRIGNN